MKASFLSLHRRATSLLRLVVTIEVGNSTSSDTHRLTETDVGHYAVSERVNIVQLGTKHSPVGGVKTVSQHAYSLSRAPPDLLGPCFRRLESLSVLRDEE